MKIPASWRTTLAGLVSGLASIVVIISSLLGQPVVVKDNEVTVAPLEQSPTGGEIDMKGVAAGGAILVAAGGLLFARDNNVSSESAGVKK